ncbi:hypothetical protein SERLADRAFT_431596 [Serpula lacrymans var. lacrymans S7.9]|uniref:Cytochrome P450 n=1 Tax=Serpula lacrymans var. lacrymans (strain S7.9) TaxID=578457 RepID=F8ND40_SERL9|nr:uncharacterized protein SERLADRAFT_431596 [Serpula lacrymans var. lacrymans S7.9]EGO30124.1 hypothetical protein SERLADRAFT_431596 [Serpula lacrymans var. lacrymans S7.9]
MARGLPPGVTYVAQCLPGLLLPPASTFALISIIETLLDVRVSAFQYTCAVLLSLPVAFVLSVQYTAYVNRRGAAARGAVMPPYVQSDKFAGVDLVAAMVHDFKNNHPVDLMNEWSEKYGHTFTIRTFFENKIFTSEPEHVKAILASQFNDFAKGPMRYQLSSLLGEGVFSSDGDVWKFHRSMTRPFFTRDRISHFDIFNRHAEDVIEQIRIRLLEGYPIDFQDAIRRFTLDSATEFLFGKDVKSLSAGLPYPPNSPLDIVKSHPANDFAEAFGDAQMASALRSRYGGKWPLAEFWKDKVHTYMDVIDEFVNPIIAEALEKKKAMQSSSGNDLKGNFDREVKDGETLLDHLVNYTEDLKMLKDETLNIMIAGGDTTASTLSFMIYQLSQNPRILDRLREEIINKVGLTDRPTYDDIRDMKYLRAVINETLRLHPAVPSNIRINYSVLLMHRRKDLWGPDAQDFDPDRFIDERLHKYLTANPFIFIPFNAGPRICLGQQFAYNQISFFLIRFLQKFSSITLATDEQFAPPSHWAGASDRKSIEKIYPKYHLTMYVHGGVWVRLEEAVHE